MDNNSEKDYIPPFPTPVSNDDKSSLWKFYKRGRKSFLHTLKEGSYSNDLSVNSLSGYKIYAPKRPQDVKQVLKTDYTEFPKHRFMDDILKPLLGDSIFTTNGEVWERQRRIMDIGFERAGLKNVYSLMIDAVKEMHGRLEKACKNGVVDIDQEMTHVTADVIMRTILSSPIESDKALEVFHHFDEFQQKSTSLNMLNTFRLPKWVALPTYLKWKKRGKQIRSIIGEIISKRYLEYKDQKGETSYGDILEALMDTEDPVTKTKFNETELIDQVVMLFLAGHETSASALGWTLYILANQPHHAEALASEAQATWGEQEYPDFKQIHKLKKTRDAFREVLRLYPPVPLISRQSSGKCPLGDRPLNTEDTVNISTWILHRHTKLWKDPHAFKPERFEQGENKSTQGAYIPFSMGPRICVGAGFALQEAILITSTIVHRYQILPDPNHHPDPVGRLTLRSQTGINLILKKRTEPVKVAPATSDTTTPESECPFNHG